MQPIHTTDRTAQSHNCTASAHSRTALLRSCTMLAMLACRAIHSHELADAVHPFQEDKCSGTLHLYSEKHCTAPLGSSSIVLGSEHSSQSACTTPDNSWLRPYTAPTLAHVIAAQGVIAAHASHSLANGKHCDQSAMSPTSTVFPRAGLRQTLRGDCLHCLTDMYMA